MNVYCRIEQVEVEGDYDNSVDGVSATCKRCGNTSESAGTEMPSIKRCMVLLGQSCPKKESNWYIPDLENVDWLDPDYN